MPCAALADLLGEVDSHSCDHLSPLLGEEVLLANLDNDFT